jgi:hypothetical protein
VQNKVEKTIQEKENILKVDAKQESSDSALSGGFVSVNDLLHRPFTG